MSNHYHLVVKLSPGESREWSDEEVLERWTSLFRGPLLVQRYRARERLSAPEQDTLRDLVRVYRTRLTSLSWFMKCLNEPIARQANAEDQCTGHFWEARFHSQALRSNQALLAAMAYVDLNPIRANKARTPEHSQHTSIKTRIEGDCQSVLREAVARLLERKELRRFAIPLRPLMPLADSAKPSIGGQVDEVLPTTTSEYLELVDVSGRIVRKGERGRRDSSLEQVLMGLGMTLEQWADASTRFRDFYRNGSLNLKRSA